MKVRCFEPKYLKGEQQVEGYHCQHFDHDRHICLAKSTGGAKKATVFPSKTRKCSLYKEKVVTTEQK